MKSILVTGGTGSFGQAFTRYLLAHTGCRRIAIYSRGEHLQETMAREIPDERLRFFIGDVRDLDRLEMAMRGVDTVVHAAALKVVPIAEYNPTECVATNVYGAENVVKAALRSGVERVLALSTDKAVNPINLYGATKLAAEKIFVAANALGAGSCRFGVVRYGNVVGSRGSVIPLFKKLASEGQALPITDSNMTRFWITMEQAVRLVADTLRTLEGREIVIPKIPSMRVTDLAEAINPDGERMMIGIRPGEKIHECLMTEDESRFAIDIGDHYSVHPKNEGAGRLPTGFRYASDTNTEWLSVEQLRAMI